MKMTMSTEQWWNDTDRNKLKYLKKILSKCYLLHNKSQWYGPGSNSDFVRTPQITPCGSIGRTKVFIFVRGVNVCENHTKQIANTVFKKQAFWC